MTYQFDNSGSLDLSKFLLGSATSEFSAYSESTRAQLVPYRAMHNIRSGTFRMNKI
jgi:hypothetical protein